MVQAKPLAGGQPVTRIVQYIAQTHANITPIHADVFVGLPERAGPRPRLIEHAAVQVPAKRFAQHVLAAMRI